MLPNFPNIKRKTTILGCHCTTHSVWRLDSFLHTLRVITTPSTAFRRVATAQTDKGAVVHTPDAMHSLFIFLSVVTPLTGQPSEKNARNNKTSLSKYLAPQEAT